MNKEECQTMADMLLKLKEYEGGKLLMKFLANECGVGKFHCNEENATSVAIAMGKLKVYQVINTMLDMSPEQIYAYYGVQEDE